MAKVKETEFFNHNYEKGVDWYHAQFPDEGNSVAGEISNCYYTEPFIIERVQGYSPEMKIMVNVRDPYGLLKSFHGFGIRRGLALPSLENSLDVPIGMLMGAGYDYRKQHNQLTDGDVVPLIESVMLSGLLQSVFESFPAEQVYVFVFERLKNEKQAVIQEMYEFLGVDSQFVPPVADEIVNASMAPKSKLIARMATRVSYLLRRIGAYGILSALHQSRLIKQMFYSDGRTAKGSEVNPREVLDAETRQQLDQEILDMMETYPPLKRWWSHLIPQQPTVSEVG